MRTNTKRDLAARTLSGHGVVDRGRLESRENRAKLTQQPRVKQKLAKTGRRSR
jgi:hypothetical protein